jgi:hypothetical protein
LAAYNNAGKQSIRASCTATPGRHGRKEDNSSSFDARTQSQDDDSGVKNVLCVSLGPVSIVESLDMKMLSEAQTHRDPQTLHWASINRNDLVSQLELCFGFCAWQDL